jgi:hypothetical protein
MNLRVFHTRHAFMIWNFDFSGVWSITNEAKSDTQFKLTCSSLFIVTYCEQMSPFLYCRSLCHYPPPGHSHFVLSTPEFEKHAFRFIARLFGETFPTLHLDHCEVSSWSLHQAMSSFHRPTGSFAVGLHTNLMTGVKRLAPFFSFFHIRKVSPTLSSIFHT